MHEALTGRLVLDVGCGGGRLAADLLADSGCRVVGVDPSMSQMRRVSRRGRAVPSMASAGALPFRHEVFDAVVSSCALKHWPDPVAGLQECARVTRPGGQVIIVEIDGDSTPAEVRAFARRTRIPPGLREAYVRFAMTTVIGVAPSLATLGGLVKAVYPAPVITKVEGLPFAVATAAR